MLLVEVNSTNVLDEVTEDDTVPDNGILDIIEVQNRKNVPENFNEVQDDLVLQDDLKKIV